jgi:beta-hydroxyacyl-ACP dehydratase FabZ
MSDPVRDIQWIREILPHRYPLLLVDRVLELDVGKRIVAIKNVTANEPVFLGHFPGQPVFPGVLLVEAMAQAGGMLLLNNHSEAERREMLTYFTTIERAKFRRPVVPGDQVRFEAEVVRLRTTTAKLAVKAYVDGKVVAEATVSVATVKR